MRYERSFLVIVVGLGILATSLLYMSSTAYAEQKPYQAYKVYNGCLYITPQGFVALDTGWVPAAECK